MTVMATCPAIKVELKLNPERVKFTFRHQVKRRRTAKANPPVETTVAVPRERPRPAYENRWFAAADAVAADYYARVKPKLYHVIPVDRDRGMFEAEADTPPDGRYYLVASDERVMCREFANRWQAEVWANYLNGRVTPA